MHSFNIFPLHLPIGNSCALRVLFLKETFLYIALFPDFIRIFIDWKNE